MFYHASQTPNLSVLTPHVSNHGKALVYLSSKRENTLVYLSNAVEKYCQEIEFIYDKPYKKWASYGFSNNVLYIDEYYPNALVDTYKGISGYIYSTSVANEIEQQSDIPFAFTTTEDIVIENCEYIKDAYEAILLAKDRGKIRINRFEELSEQQHHWIANVIKNEYATSQSYPDYQLFLRAKFSNILS